MVYRFKNIAVCSKIWNIDEILWYLQKSWVHIDISNWKITMINGLENIFLKCDRNTDVYIVILEKNTSTYLSWKETVVYRFKSITAWNEKDISILQIGISHLLECWHCNTCIFISMYLVGKWQWSRLKVRNEWDILLLHFSTPSSYCYLSTQ